MRPVLQKDFQRACRTSGLRTFSARPRPVAAAPAATSEGTALESVQSLLGVGLNVAGVGL